jgi:hypothetical protein
MLDELEAEHATRLARMQQRGWVSRMPDAAGRYAMTLRGALALTARNVWWLRRMRERAALRETAHFLASVP